MYARFLGSLLVTNLLICSTVLDVAHAESTGAALRTFGIVGTWSNDCSRVRGFWRTTWEAPMLIGESAATNVYTNNDGETTTQIFTIEEATRVTEDKIKIISVAGKPSGPPPPPPYWLQEQGDTWESVLLKVGQRYRVILSASADGKKIRVKGGFAFRKLEDGTFENTNRQTGLIEKCLNESATESLAYSAPSPAEDSDKIFNNGGVIDNAATPKLPTRESGNYEQHCRDTWTKVGVLNKQMFDYCVNLDSEGYDELVSLSNTYKNLWWIEPAIGDALTHWTKRGSRQDEMVAFEVRLQVDSFREMLFQSKQDSFDQELYKRCFVKWNKNPSLPGTQHSVDWRQIEHCYKQAR
jgi:hypothetical protein